VKNKLAQLGKCDKKATTSCVAFATKIIEGKASLGSVDIH
jgi:CO dehydrogenase/acetyl-CoA synthase gamma subunit (corrinoid Fe-S protein)